MILTSEEWHDIRKFAIGLFLVGLPFVLVAAFLGGVIRLDSGESICITRN